MALNNKRRPIVAALARRLKWKNPWKKSKTGSGLTWTYFTDRDLGKAFPRIMRAADLSVVAHDDVFDEHTSDEVWLKYVGENGLIGVTHNKNIKWQLVFFEF